MVDDERTQTIQRVARLIAEADALLITAGAGMGVDSGLPDFRGSEGFWRAYPALGRLGISFEEMAQPQWFTERPEMAWAFYGHRQALYRGTKPHDGFRILLEWGQAMPGGYFVVTSNVDGHFQYAGYPGHCILERHGNIHRHQCTIPCANTIWHYEPPDRWLDHPPDFQIDLTTLTANGRLPRCPECGALARPNVLMFGDGEWIPDVMRVQQERYAGWLTSVRGRRVVVLEFGAGGAIPTIRRIGEDLAERDVATLVRINPDATDGDEPAIPIRMGALETLNQIAADLPEDFRERCRNAVPEPPRLRIFDEAEDASPGTRQRKVSQSIESIKWSKVYAKAWQITLPSGSTAWVEQVDVHRTYLGMLTGLPFASVTEAEIAEARQFVRKHFYGPEPVVIPPRVFDASSNVPILPPLRFAARIRSWEKVNDEDEGSWMNLVWFAEIDDDKSIKAFVAEALRQVDWKKQATGYSA
jgi:NAD-dependent SIR2 family protein deacetylase